MPPVMGAAGFLIASFLNVPYTHVMLAAFFPASLYYLTLLVQVDSHAAFLGLGGIPRSELPKTLAVLREGWFFIGSLVLLTFVMVYMRVEAWAPFYVMIFLFVCATLRKETRYTWRKFADFLVESGKLLAQITAILAGIGLIIGSLSGTGVANSFSRELVLFAGGNLFLLLVLGAITSFILGIGMTVTACYVFLAIVLVPALVEIGVNGMAAHLFVLYWGCLSYITPPVALASITAAAISGSDPIRTGFLSMRLGSAKYIVPFMFVLDPTMILIGPVEEIIMTVITAILGGVVLAGAIEGYLYLVGVLSPVYRVLFFSSGFMLMYPKRLTEAAGLIILVLGILIKKRLGRSDNFKHA